MNKKYLFISTKKIIAKTIAKKKQTRIKKSTTDEVFTLDKENNVYEINGKYLRNISQTRDVQPVRSINGNVVEFFAGRDTKITIQLYFPDNIDFDYNKFENVKMKFETIIFLPMSCSTSWEGGYITVDIEGTVYETIRR